MIKPGKLSGKPAWIILGICFWVAVLRFIPADFLDLGGDSAQYITLSESLSQGRGLRMLNYPAEPLSFYYPPVFPLLLFPIIHFLGRNFYAMHLLVAGFGFGCLALFYKSFREHIDKRLAFLIAGFLGLNWVFISYCSNSILSDIPYMFFSGFTLLCLDRYIERPGFLGREAFLCLSGLILSYFTRYAGVILLPAAMASIGLSGNKDKFKKACFLGCGFILVFAAWNTLRYLSPAGPGSHFAQVFLVDPYAPDKGNLFNQPVYFILRLIEGINYYYGLTYPVFFRAIALKNLCLRDLLCASVLLFTALGLWVNFKKNKGSAFHYYFLFYLALICFWPFREGLRFLLPALPFIFFYFFSGLKATLDLLFSRPLLYPWGRGFFYLALVLLFMANIPGLAVRKQSYEDMPAVFKNFISLHAWAKENLADEGVFISRKPAITYFYTGHKADVYPYTQDAGEIWEHALDIRARYMVVDEFSAETRRYFLPFIYKYKDRFRLLRRQGDSLLLEVLEK